MTTKEKLTTVGFPFPSDPKLLIFRARIEAMLQRETYIPEDRELFSAQYQYESFLKGGPKRMRSLSARIENNLRSKDGKTTERYKNKQRERGSTLKRRDGVKPLESKKRSLWMDCFFSIEYERVLLVYIHL